MNANSNNFKHHRCSGFKFALILILVGLVFLAVNTGLLPTMYQPLFTSWPIWLVFIGLISLMDFSWFGATVFLSAGIFFIIPQIGTINPALNIPADFTHLYWPALLVVAGIYFILARSFRPRHFCGKHCHKDFDHTSTWNCEDGFVRVSSSFDSRKNIVLDPVFKGGTVDSSFGEVILDLRKTTLPEGKTKLSVNVSFGSVQIIVPSGWNVQMQGDSFFGTFTDNRLSPSFNTEDLSILLLEGKCAFGECRLRD
jgi:predicted membrane protein